MDTRVKLLLAVCVTVVLLGSGSYLAYSTITVQTQANTEVQATVISSELDTEGQYDDDFYVSIEYEYTFEGKRYTSSSVYPGSDSRIIDDKERAQSILEQYSEGETVTAYVNADDPSESYLIELNLFGTILGSLVLLGLGLIALLATILYGAGIVFDLFQPGPEEVNLSRAEVRHELLDTFEDIEEYPITSTREIRQSSLEYSRTINFHTFEVTVGTLDSLLASDLDKQCETPEELTEFFLREMDEQGYFSAADPSRQ